MLTTLLHVGAHEPDNTKEVIKSKINHCEHHGENGAIVKPSGAEGGDDQNIERVWRQQAWIVPAKQVPDVFDVSIALPHQPYNIQVPVNFVLALQLSS